MKSPQQLLPRRWLQRQSCLSLFPRQFQEFAMPDMQPYHPPRREPLFTARFRHQRSRSETLGPEMAQNSRCLSRCLAIMYPRTLKSSRCSTGSSRRYMRCPSLWYTARGHSRTKSTAVSGNAGQKVVQDAARQTSCPFRDAAQHREHGRSEH